jgi:hypothetical protein
MHFTLGASEPNLVYPAQDVAYYRPLRLLGFGTEEEGIKTLATRVKEVGRL